MSTFAQKISKQNPNLTYKQFQDVLQFFKKIYPIF